MEYKIEEYRRKGGKIASTPDGYKYFLNSRPTSTYIYLKCVLFRKACKGSAKLIPEVNLIFPKTEHNHNVEEYKAEVFALKAKCRKRASSSKDNLREIFNNVTRTDPSAHQITFKECESLMYRARCDSQPRLPKSAVEFCEMLPTTNFAANLKATIKLDERIAIIFFSEKISTLMADIHDIQYDGTFYVVPKLFYQLFTIFLTVGRHSIPAIHCLMTNKDEELYTAVILKIKELIPQLQPTSTMSDWERGSRNAFKHVYPGTKLYGCWFHYTQAIWKHIQKYGLASSYRHMTELESFLRQIMAIPFLPGDLIHSTYSFLQIPALPRIEKLKLDDFLKYFKRSWLIQVKSNELSIFDLENVTNNGAESYHARLKCLFKTSHPQIWKFMDTLNTTIADCDNEISRLEQGKDITRSRKIHVRVNMEYRKSCKEKLMSGIYTPWEFLNSISRSLSKTTLDDSSIVYISDDSDVSEEEPEQELQNLNSCVVCLGARENTWIFLPCKHANCCELCTQTITQMGNTCPTCRTPIVDTFQIFLS